MIYSKREVCIFTLQILNFEKKCNLLIIALFRSQNMFQTLTEW